MLMLSVESSTGYAELIKTFLHEVFPNTISNPCEVLEALTQAFVSTAQVRYGPQPSPEGLVRIRSVIRTAIEQQAPIPVLMPWGTKKPHNAFTVDAAEISALKQIVCLNERIKRVYAPGMEMRVRVEDTSGFFLFCPEGHAARVASQRYIEDFSMLVRILDIPVTLVYESNMMNAGEYYELAESFINDFFLYLVETDMFGLDKYEGRESYKKLRAQGWQGDIPQIQREFYYSRYRKSFPSATHEEHTMYTARYFASVLARKILKGYGNTDWNDFIQVSFSPPVPGTPDELARRIINYRTVLMRHARTHLPPWRARGYLLINGNSVSPKLTTWNEPLDTHVAEAKFERNGESLTLNIEHVIEA